MTNTDFDALKIREIDLPPRVRNCLLNNNCRTVGEARKLSDHDMLLLPNFGLTSLRSWKRWLMENDTDTDRVFRARDGFEGTVIGEYKTREGVLGLVLQQTGTKVVHVYRTSSVEMVSS